MPSAAALPVALVARSRLSWFCPSEESRPMGRTAESTICAATQGYMRASCKVEASGGKWFTYAPTSERFLVEIVDYAKGGQCQGEVHAICPGVHLIFDHPLAPHVSVPCPSKKGPLLSGDDVCGTPDVHTWSNGPTAIYWSNASLTETEACIGWTMVATLCRGYFLDKSNITGKFLIMILVLDTNCTSLYAKL
jgi:hypothetical protein